MRLLSSWSGGKDSCYALMKIVSDNNDIPVALLNVMNEEGRLSRSHGIPLTVLKSQARAMNLPLETCAATWENYENNFIKKLNYIKEKYQADTAVFGDIDITAHRDWEEKVCKVAGLTPLLPLWQEDRKDLVMEMISNGVKAIIVSCNKTLGTSFLGKEITLQTLQELEDKGVDCCGENGEYHTLVVDCPLFNFPLKLPKYSKVVHENYCFLVWDDKPL